MVKSSETPIFTEYYAFLKWLFEREIDRLVYDLHGLAPEEIELVEESAQR